MAICRYSAGYDEILEGNIMKIINLVEDTKGNELCEYEHGLSFYIETENHKLLVDTGATDMSLRNAKKLGIDLSKVDTVVLSHGHYDHSGGIMPFSKLNSSAKIYMRDNVDGEYYNLKDNKEKYIGIDKNIMNLSQCVLVAEDIKIDDELYIFTGVKGNKYPAKGNLMLKEKKEDGFIQDAFTHEQFLVISCASKKILISGCAHNGIINILDRYFDIYSSYPDIVISGFHMIQKDDYTNGDVGRIKNTAVELLKTNAMFYSGHCTGQEAFDIMKEIMQDKLIQIHSGDVII